MNELISTENKITRVRELLPVMNILALLMIWRSNYCTSQLVIAYFPPIIFMGLFAVWFVFAMMTDATFLKRFVDKSWALLVFIILNVCIDLFFSMTIKLEMINCLIALFMFAMMVFYAGRKDCDKFKKLIIFVVVIDLLIKIIYSISEITINPAIIKQMSTAGASQDREVSILIADYSTVYACVAVSIFMLGIWRKVSDRALRILALACALILAYFIFICSFFFALLLFVYGLLILFVIKRKKNYALFPLALFCLVLVFKQPIADFCWQMSQQPYWNDIIQGKWNDMYMLLSYGSDAAYMSDMRLDLMQESLETFFKYPLFGVYGLDLNGRAGGHSAWLDGLANYGILRYALFVLFLVSIFKEMLKGNKRKKPLYAVISIYILLSVVNPNVFPQIWVTFAILIPFYYQVMDGKEKEKK